MRLFTQSIYDQQVFNSSTYYTDPEHDALLGSAEKLVVQLITENPSAAIVVGVTVQHSNDDRNWYSKSTEVITSGAISSSAVTSTIGADTGPNGSFVRLKIVVGSSPTGSARLRLIVCGRAEQTC